MDFDHAAQRLARDQKKRRNNKKPAAWGGAVSVQAQQQAARQRRQQEERLAQRAAQQRHADQLQQYLRSCQRALHVQTLPHKYSTVTSIHGHGDKIALPPSALEWLTTHHTVNNNHNDAGAPWMFRIGIRNPDYVFPQSPRLQAMKFDEDDDMHEDDEDDEEEDLSTAAYLDELSHQYLAYTHGTVVEFTQDEGCIGLPETIAAALIQQNPDKIPATRTVDPSKAPAETAEEEESGGTTTPPSPTNGDDDDYGEKTAGHLAWGAFDVPDVPQVEVSLVQLPKGQACTLVPTDANAFYQVPNLKLMLEQSLMRTRAVLSVGDVVPTWHRGVRYAVRVTHVTPPDYRAILCINTDLTVEFGQEPTEEEAAETMDVDDPKEETTEKGTADTSNGYTLAGGRTLADTTTSSSDATATTAPLPATTTDNLPPEPEPGAPHACTLQIRGATTPLQRRFDAGTATVADVFAWVAPHVPASFRLVTRFPRRVYEHNHAMTLQSAGFQGQELLFVERL